MLYICEYFSTYNTDQYVRIIQMMQIGGLTLLDRIHRAPIWAKVRSIYPRKFCIFVLFSFALHYCCWCFGGILEIKHFIDSVQNGSHYLYCKNKKWKENFFERPFIRFRQQKFRVLSFIWRFLFSFFLIFSFPFD